MTETGPNTCVSDRLSRIPVALADGRPVVLLDDDEAEPLGYLVVAGDRITGEAAAFVIRHSSGFLCAAMTTSRCDQLGLPVMNGIDSTGHGQFAVAVDARQGVTTGISAGDRAHTIRLLASPSMTRADFTRPGHVLPVRVEQDDLVGRGSAAAACLDLVIHSETGCVAAFAIMTSDRDPATMPDRAEIVAIAHAHELPLVTRRQLADGATPQLRPST